MRLIANNRLVDKPRIAPPLRMSTEKFNKRIIFMLINPASGGLIILFTERGLEMTETERITNEVMSNCGFDAKGRYHAPEYPHANVLGEGPNVSELRNDDGIAFFTGIRNALAFEVLAGLAIWGLWELHYPIMVLAHWLVAHAR
jgi:hypothetical protein